MNQQLITNLNQHQNYAPIIPAQLLHGSAVKLNLTASNPKLKNFDFNDIKSFTKLINNSLSEAGAGIGVGGYGENRVMYVHSQLFTKQTEEARSVHLGVDTWGPAYTPVYAPLPGTVHSFQDNVGLGDYGPTIILEHTLDDIKFYTLYGHLSRQSLIGLTNGQQISAGQQIASFGAPEENGQWPPHLHFQIISDLLGKSGDFPGVCKPSEQDYWLNLCPNPNLILRLPILD